MIASVPALATRVRIQPHIHASCVMEADVWIFEHLLSAPDLLEHLDFSVSVVKSCTKIFIFSASLLDFLLVSQDEMLTNTYTVPTVH